MSTAGIVERTVINRALFILLWLELFVIAIFALEIWLDANNRREAQHRAQETLLSVLAEGVESRLQRSIQDLDFLATNPSMTAWGLDPSPENQARAEEVLGGLLLSRLETLDKVRLILPNGDEVIRIQSLKDGISTLPEGRLQNKAHRYYHIIGKALALGDTYISPIDLNVDYGQVERPFKSIIRMVQPLPGAIEGAAPTVLVNLAADPMLTLPSSLDRPLADIELLVARGDGYWLKGPDQERTWSFMFPSQPSYSVMESHPKLWEAAVALRQAGRRHGVEAASGASIEIVDLTLGRSSASDAQTRGPRELVFMALPSSRAAAQPVISAVEDMAFLFALFSLAAVMVSTGASAAITYRQEIGSSKKEVGVERQSILDAIPDPLLIVNESGAVVAANEACGNLLGYHRKALLRTNVDSLVPNMSREAHARLRASYMAAPKRAVSLKSRVFTVLDSNGEEIPVAISLNYEHTIDGMNVIAVLRPVTEDGRVVEG